MVLFNSIVIQFLEIFSCLQNPVVHILRGDLEEEALIEDGVVVTKSQNENYKSCHEPVM